MLQPLKQKLAARRLAAKQKAAAVELQAIYDTRKALQAREKYLVRLAASLAAHEVEMNVATRRTHRAHLG